MDIPTWEKLSSSKQDLYLTILWKDGYSEGAIAQFFSTTKGRIVRRRQTTLKLPTEGRPPSQPKVDPERFRDLLDIDALDTLEEKRGAATIKPPAKSPPKPEATHIEPPACQWPLADSTSLKPRLCGKPAVPGHRLCDEHLAQLFSPRRFR